MKTKEWSARRPQHIVAKIVCLFLAVVLWLYVMYAAAPTYEAVYENVVVTVYGDSTEWEIDNATISVRVQGTKQELATYGAESIVAYVLPSDLPDAQPLATDGFYSFPVRFRMPAALSVKGDYTVVVHQLGEEPS